MCSYTFMKFVATECPEHCELINHSAVLAIFTTQFPLKVIAYKHQELTNQHSRHRGYEPTFTTQRLRTNIHGAEVTNIHIAEITKIHSTEVMNQCSQRRGYELTFLAQRLRTNIHSIHKLLIVEYYLLSTIYDTTVLSMTISFLLIPSSFPLEKEPKRNSRNVA